MDFNVHTNRIDDPCDNMDVHGDAPSPGSESKGTYEVVRGPTVVPQGNLFKQDVVTHLPFSTSRRTFKTHYSGFMIDEERLVGMKVRSTRECVSNDVALTGGHGDVRYSRWHSHNPAHRQTVTSTFLCFKLRDPIRQIPLYSIYESTARSFLPICRDTARCR